VPSLMLHLHERPYVFLKLFGYLNIAVVAMRSSLL
jgi:hypothetical protein